MADKGNDPFAVWQTMLGEMEKGFNAFANKAMASPEFSRGMNQAGGATAGAQKQFVELMEKYLLSMNMPSRAQLVDMAARLQGIEAQIAEIKALLQGRNSTGGGTTGPAAPPRPPRTKRPPEPSGEQK